MQLRSLLGPAAVVAAASACRMVHGHGALDAPGDGETSGVHAEYSVNDGWGYQ